MEMEPIEFFNESPTSNKKPGSCKAKPCKIVKTKYGTECWSRIKAHQARNYDGELANWKKGTPDGDRTVLEKKFIPSDPSIPIRYTNYW